MKRLSHLRHLAILMIFLLWYPIEPAGFANAEPTTSYQAPLSRDLPTRQSTQAIRHVGIDFSGYFGVSFLSERNKDLDDGLSDISDEYFLYLELIGKKELSPIWTAYGHLQFSGKRRATHLVSSPADFTVRIKELYLSADVSPTSTLTFGRIRLSDRNRWIVDRALDGGRFMDRGDGHVLELAMVNGDEDVPGQFAIFHYAKIAAKRNAGIYQIIERNAGNTAFHLSGYLNNRTNDGFVYHLNLAAISTSGTDGYKSGLGMDFRAIARLSNHKWQPHLVLGFAIGSKDFRQTGLQTNKTTDGGKTLIYRYGIVFKPELSNLATVSIGVSVRPAKNLSLNANIHLYRQTMIFATTPAARVLGATNGFSAFLGSEVNVVATWRPSKKIKIDGGIGWFMPGSAYVNRKESATRVQLRATFYF